MNSILILLAHPVLERSQIHRRLLHHVNRMTGVTVHDLYQKYPDFNIDIEAEQALLLKHDIIVWQHPFYWYSAPALLKQWQDLVLEHGWAYGAAGTKLAGKKIMNAISSGGSENAYQPGGRNRYSIPQFLTPFNQTAHLCKMEYLPPFVVCGSYTLSAADADLHGQEYVQLLAGLQHDRITSKDWTTVEIMNELLPIPTSLQT